MATETREVQRLRAKLAAASEVCELPGRRQELDTALGRARRSEAVSKQQPLGPHERLNAPAMCGMWGRTFCRGGAMSQPVKPARATTVDVQFPCHAPIPQRFFRVQSAALIPAPTSAREIVQSCRVSSALACSRLALTSYAVIEWSSRPFEPSCLLNSRGGSKRP